MPWSFLTQRLVMFGPEPEEKPKKVASKKRPKVEKKPFGAEPEEKPRQKSSGSKVIKIEEPFGDEPEEKPRQKSSGSTQGIKIDHDLAGEKPSAPLLEVSWSALHTFQRSNFISTGAEASQPQKKKRAYDNSNREAAAMPKGEDFSYRVAALRPGRLQELKDRDKCQCVMAW